MVEPAGVRPGQGTPVPKEGPAPVDPYGTPGSDLFEWYSINDALRQNGMGDGSWRIAGLNHVPVAQVEYIKNPAFDPLKNPDVDPYITRPKNDYVIGLVNDKTHKIYQLHLSRSTPGADGKYTYSVSDLEDKGNIDTSNPGYKDVQQLPFADGHKELWGTNTATGAFEKMPGSPSGLGNTKGWNDVRQIEQTGPDGKRVLVWVGTDPDGKPLQRIADAPTQQIDKYVPGSVKQVTKTVNGVTKQVYVGMNAQTQQWEDIPELGSETQLPKTTTSPSGNVVYTVGPDGQLIPAPGIAQPVEGVSTRWVPAEEGYGKKQIFRNGEWQDDIETDHLPVSAAAKRAEGAIPPKGTIVWTPAGDKLIGLTADGNGGTIYQLGPNGEPPPVKPIPGITQPTSAGTAGAGDEFLPQRRDPITGNLLPPEKNVNWNPTNVADRMRQLQVRAKDMQTQLHGQVTSGQISEDEADKQFNSWWDQNIEPARQEIQIAQQNKLQDENRQNLQTAQNAGNSVLQAYSKLSPVGSGYGDFWAKVSQGYGKDMPNNMTADDWNKAFVVDDPGYAKIYEQATAQALQHISPTASAIANGPGSTPTALQGQPDLTSSLNRNQYLYAGGGGGAPGMPGAGGPPQTNVSVQQNLGTQQAAAAAAANGGKAPMSTAALNAMGLVDNPAGRALAAGQSSVPGAPPIYPGQFNPIYQQGTPSAVGQPATGPVAGQMIPGLGVPYNPSGPPADYAVYSPKGYSMPSTRLNPQDLDPGMTTGAPDLGSPPPGNQPTGPVTPTPAVPSNSSMYQQLLQQMDADRQAMLARSRAAIPTTWNGWGQYTPSR